MTDQVDQEELRPSRRATASGQIRRLVAAISQGDDALVQDTITQLGSRHRYLAPLGMVVGAFAMLFEGLRLVVTNWRLTLVQVLPAMWIWIAMLDLKAHVLHGKSFHVLRGPILIPIILLIAAITAAGFYLNGVFAFAIAKPGPPEIRPAFAQARGHLPIVLGSGFVVGLLLGVATMVFPRWGSPWFAVALSIVIGIMMVLYVSLPSRLIGMKTTYSKVDALKATAVGGALGAAVCSPPYAIGRVGILMLGSHALFIPGLFVLAFGVVLQTGATSSVKAIKMSAKLVAGNHPPPAAVVAPDEPTPGA
jgi:hypothetical protein